jgi:PAS domain S-box-containing protein
MLDPSGVVINWNPGAERLKGYTADEILGQHFSKFYTREECAAGMPGHVLEIAEET